MNTRKNDLANMNDELSSLLDSFVDIIQSIRRAYPAVEPGPAYRQALQSRLVTEAQWMKAHPQSERHNTVKAAAFGAAAVAGLAVVAWRLFSHPQLRTAESN